MVVFLSISLVATPPMVSMDRDRGVTSSNRISPAPASPASLPPWIEAPIATHSSGFRDLLGSLPVNALTFPVQQAAQAQQGAQGAAGPDMNAQAGSNAGSNADDDVIDGDFREV